MKQFTFTAVNQINGSRSFINVMALSQQSAIREASRKASKFNLVLVY
jgi:hypothetical protein